MDREITWTDPAWEDVENAADYIAQDSKFYAAAFVQEIKEAAASLANFAERGQVVPEFGDESIRELSDARAWSAAPSEVLTGTGPQQPGPDNTRLLSGPLKNAAAQPHPVRCLD